MQNAGTRSGSALFRRRKRASLRRAAYSGTAQGRTERPAPSEACAGNGQPGQSRKKRSAGAKENAACGRSRPSARAEAERGKKKRRAGGWHAPPPAFLCAPPRTGEKAPASLAALRPGAYNGEKIRRLPAAFYMHGLPVIRMLHEYACSRKKRPFRADALFPKLLPRLPRQPLHLHGGLFHHAGASPLPHG